MSPYWLNNSCSPFSPIESACTLGNLASYAINVTNVDDITAGLRFATDYNIRLTVKNTGHDFLGRSAGEGSLALWTYNLKSISFANYSGPGYTGPAIKLGAGVQAFEAYSAAADRGLRITSGICPTVGIAGGYVQGGGHGALEGLYGLAADNTLEFEVVTAAGKFVNATPTENADLYWALNGGGGGTYAVVLSQTARAYVDGRVAGASRKLNNTVDEAYWASMEAWQELLLDVDSIEGLNTIWGLTNDTFVLSSALLPHGSADDMSAILEPFIQKLKDLNLNYTFEVSEDATFYDHFSRYTPSLPYGEYLTNSTIGGRLIPRHTVRDSLPALLDTFRNITTTGSSQFRINGIGSNVTHARVGNNASSNAVLPAWRDSLYTTNMDVFFAADAPREVIDKLQGEMNEKQDLLKAVTPGSGAYMNEGTFDNPDWKVDYYGENYGRLLDVKTRHDPGHILYGPASVGSEFWRVASDGRLCKA